MENLLETIVAETRQAVEAAQSAVPERVLRERVPLAPPARDLAATLAAPGLRVIAEVKRASPSAGVIREGVDPAAVARSYQANGAAAVSVLTEPRHFQGSLDDLRQVRAAVTIPVLRKDFIVDPYQVLESRAAGADAVLLIAAILDDEPLRRLLALARSLSLSAVVEVHSQAELERVLATPARIIGINNRDLATLAVDLAVTETLMTKNNLVDRIVVSESGITTRQDLGRLEAAGVDAVLIGESLMRADDPGGALRKLVSPWL